MTRCVDNCPDCTSCCQFCVFESNCRNSCRLTKKCVGLGESFEDACYVPIKKRPKRTLIITPQLLRKYLKSRREYKAKKEGAKYGD